MDRTQIGEVDIHEGIENTLTILAHKLKQGQVKVDRDYDAAAAITAHGSQLNQVWTNLLSNALDALDGDGHDPITTRCPARASPSNRGRRARHPGRDPSQIFDPFFTTKTVGKGTGLGLDIARRIVVGHRGNISVKSQPGETRFTVMLPTG